MAVGGNDGGGGRAETRPTTPEAPRPSRLRRLSARALQMQSTVAWQDEQDAMHARQEEKEGEGVARRKETSTAGPAKDPTLVAIEQLTSIVLSQQAQIEGMGTKFGGLEEQLLESRNEVKALHQWIKENAPSWSQSPPTAGSPNLSSATWPSLPTAGESGYVTGQTVSPNSSTSQRVATAALPSISMELSKVAFSGEDAGALKKRFNDAFATMSPTKDVKCSGILKSPGEGGKVKVLFKRREDADLVRSNDDWLKVHFRGASLQGEQWYPIKVDRVNRMAVNDGNSWTIREHAAREIGEENGVEVRNLRWLSPPSEKQYGSMVVYLAKTTDAKKLLEQQIMDFKGEAAFTKIYERRQGPTRCYRCQQFGHQESRCRNEMTCIKCAAPGHQRHACISAVPRCANCKGPHEADDRGCPKYKELLRKYQPTPHA